MFPLFPAALAAEPAVTVSSRHESWTRSPGSTKPPVEVTLPVVRVGDPGAQAKLDALLVPALLIGDPRAQLVADNWIDTVTFATAFERAGIVAFAVLVEGTAAYPDNYTRALVIDGWTGAHIGTESFTAAGKAALVQRIQAELETRRAAADPETRAMVSDVTFAVDGLEGFYPTEAGLSFRVRWGLPHAMAAGTPDPIVVVPWAAAREAIAPGAPLARAVPAAAPEK